MSASTRLANYLGQQKEPRFGHATRKQRKRIRQKAKLGKGWW